ncbi:unnamed protein product [Brassica napus]|uniref:(rape) hypothetical protein n=1 Tax=Brassica napus TaxID=3708 RepID=A0A817AMN5_BRANA|nr:unnamed protein product [Brassica napus]
MESLWASPFSSLMNCDDYLLRRGATRHDASSFTILETLMNHKANIRALFQSNSWILSQTTAKPEEGREVERCVLEDGYLEFTR